MRNFKKVILGAALSMVCTVAFAQQLTVKGVVTMLLRLSRSTGPNGCGTP